MLNNNSNILRVKDTAVFLYGGVAKDDWLSNAYTSTNHSILPYTHIGTQLEHKFALLLKWLFYLIFTGYLTLMGLLLL